MADEHEPATKGDVALVRSDLRSDLENFRSTTKQEFEQLRSEMQHIYDDLKEAIQDSQTAVLKAFYSYVESNQKRISEVEGNEAALRGRVATLETRMLEVEKRLNMPPGA